MPTKLPAQNYWQAEFLEGNYWTDPGGAGIAYNTFEMLSSSTGAVFIPGLEWTRCAMKFKTDTPSWIADGDVVAKHCILFLYLGADSSDSGAGIEVAQITAGAWNENSNFATMDGLTTPVWANAVTPLPSGKFRGWVAFPIDQAISFFTGSLGIMLKVDLTGAGQDCYKILKSPAPIVRAYYQYPLDNIVEPDAAVRLDITDDILAHTGSKGSKYRLGSKIYQANIFPAEEDVDIVLGDNPLSKFNKTLSIPLTWKPILQSGGGLVVAPSPSLSDFRGYMVETTLYQRYQQRAEVEIAKSKAIMGDTSDQEEEQQIILEDPIFNTIDRVPYYRDVRAGLEGVNILDEPAIWALASVLVNGVGIPWKRFRQEDLVWLFQRLGVVWSNVTYSGAAMLATTIKNLIEDLGEMYGVCISRGNDDAIILFHPAVYRPSLHVWELNIDDTDGAVLQEKKPVNRYSDVTVNGTAATVSSQGALSTKYDKTNKVHEVSGLTGDFSEVEARLGLGVQLARRLCGREQLLSFEMGAQGLLWEIGDQAKITWKSKDLDAVSFMVTGAKPQPNTGRAFISLVRYPDSPELHNTFTDTGLQGIWRWINWYTGAASGANMSPIGSAGSFSSGASLFNRKAIHWRGTLGDVTANAPGTFAPTDVTDTCDLVDLTLGVYGDQDTDPYTLGRDPEYNQILSFRSGNEAVIVGIHRPDTAGGGGIQAKAVENTIFLAHTLNYTPSSVAWTQIVETSPGLSAANMWQTYGIAIQWKNSDIYLYVNRNYIGSITKAKAGYTSALVEIRVPAEHLLGELRWLKRTDGEFFPTLQLQGINGVDNCYP